MLTLSDLREEVLSWMDEAGDTDTTKTIVENALNQSNAQRSTQLRWPWMMSRVYTFTAVAGQQDYHLAEGALRLEYIRNRATKRNCVEVPDEIVQQSGREFGPAADNESALYFQKVGFSPIKQPIPSPGSTLTLTSTSAEPTVSLIIEGEDAAGDSVVETLLVDGTTSATFTRVDRITRGSVAAAGTLALSTVTGALTLLTLSPLQKGKQFPVISFLAPCSSTDVIEYRFVKAPHRMTLDGDIPDVPFPYCNILVWDSLIMTAAYNEVDSEASNVWKANRDNWEQGLLATSLGGDTAGGFGEQVKVFSDDQTETGLI